MAKKVTDAEIKKIKLLREKGLTILNIANEINRSQSVVRKYIPKEGQKTLDLKGQVFGRLTVVKFSHREKGKRYWLCKCECGNMHFATTGNLRNGSVQSCGCLLRDFNENKEKYEQSVKDKKIKPKKTKQKIKTIKPKLKKTKGGVYYFQPYEVQLKYSYEAEGDRKGGEIKEYKLSPEELAIYLEQLKFKEVQRKINK